MSTEQSLQHWLSVSNCDPLEPTTLQFSDNKSGEKITAIQKNYYSISTNKQVSFVKILNGGHTIPNRNFRIPIKQLGNMNKDVDAPQII